MHSIDEVLKERSLVDELKSKLLQEEQASRAKDQQLQAHIEQTANEMQVRAASVCQLTVCLHGCMGVMLVTRPCIKPAAYRRAEIQLRQCSEMALPKNAQVHQERADKLQADLDTKNAHLQQLNKRLWDFNVAIESKCVPVLWNMLFQKEGFIA